MGWLWLCGYGRQSWALDIMACLGEKRRIQPTEATGACYIWLWAAMIGIVYNRMIVGVWGMIDAVGLALSGLWD
jgi:hypothetical protein